MKRRIVGFHQDEERHWVADLECGHTQHVRHDPPWQERPWVLTPEGRGQFLGAELRCKECLQAAARQEAATQQEDGPQEAAAPQEDGPLAPAPTVTDGAGGGAVTAGEAEPLPRIRRYRPTDLDAVYEICRRTGPVGDDPAAYEDPKALGHIYAGPYVTREPELAFVLEDDAGVAGYVLGAFDSRAYYQWYLEEWLPVLRERHPEPQGDPSTWTRTERLYHRYHHPRIDLPGFARDYPSHLHIDLLPRAQGRGHGRRLMTRFLAELRGRGSPGVHLGVGLGNTGAIGFYRRLGFHELGKHPSSEPHTLFMGLRLDGTDRAPGGVVPVSGPGRAQLEFRPLGPEDARAFFDLRLEALETSPEAFGSSAEEWRAAGPEQAAARIADNQAPDRFILGAFEDGELVGTVGFYRVPTLKSRHIGMVWGVYLRPDRRGAGIAGRMLDETIRRARALPGLVQLQLAAETTNRAAVRLYESRGFEVFGVERRALYVNGRYYDEAHMQLFLTPPGGRDGE